MFSFFKRKKRPAETPQERSEEASQPLESEVVPRETSEQVAPIIDNEATTESTQEDATETNEKKTDESAETAEKSKETAKETHKPETEKNAEIPSPADENTAQDSITEPEQIEEVSVETSTETSTNVSVEPSAETPIETSSPAEISTDKPDTSKKKGFFSRLKASLSKTRKGFTENLASLFLGKKEIDEDLLDELEMVLLTADMGVDTTDRIIQNLTDQVSRKELKDPEALYESLKIQLREILHPIEAPLTLQPKSPTVILVVGVNGAGKTTTIGKLAHQFQKEGKSVMLAAGDTFRAAAVEQLQTWGERNQVPVVAQKTGADSAAVIFDAVQSAQAKGIDVLIADTAGRLHTQSNLMEELKKVKRVISKVMPDAPHEVMLVLDAGTGQNALSQAKLFNEAVSLTGLTLTKLDGTAKGGIIFALADQLQVPVRYIGVGEGIEDLRPFHANDFIEALFDTRTTEN